MRIIFQTLRQHLCKCLVAHALVMGATGSMAVSAQAQSLSPREADGAMLAAATSPYAMPWWPDRGVKLLQNPPYFTWPYLPGRQYVLEVAPESGEIVRLVTRFNWAYLPEALPPGQYRWRVSLQGSPHDTSAWRGFDVPDSAIKFEIPSADVLLERARSAAHPRGFGQKLSVAQGVGETLLGRVNPLLGRALFDESDPATRKKLSPALYQYQLEMEDLLAAWRLTGDRRYAREAQRRLSGLTKINLEGATRPQADDQAARAVMWSLALGYDVLYDELGPEEREQIRACALARLRQFYQMLFGARNGLNNFVFDSHGGSDLSIMAATTTLLVEQGHELDALFTEVVPRHLIWSEPWGREDGGFANGTAYAQWGIGNLLMRCADVIKNSIGVDSMQSAWWQGYVKMLAYFLPPGAASGMFGDGAELQEISVWADQAKAIAWRVDDPLAQWYGGQFSGDNPSTGWRVLTNTTRAVSPSRFPPNTPNAWWIPSTGWVAMHSRLADPQRTSVYFKSSPYGSFNHSHADQNSFVIQAQGRALAIDSGYYDGYGSAHWKGWYKQTKAHNAITFDGGIGQGVDNISASGRIVKFENEDDYVLATGDATQAYGGVLTRAIRSVVYDRPDTILVYDSVASNQPRHWEWNLHASGKLVAQGTRSARLDTGGVALCVDLVSGPEVEFRQIGDFPVPPVGEKPAQWHAMWRATQASRQATFLTVLRVNCGELKYGIENRDTQMRVRLGEHVFSFGPEGAMASDR